jgi:hypothetical protein
LLGRIHARLREQATQIQVFDFQPNFIFPSQTIPHALQSGTLSMPATNLVAKRRNMPNAAAARKPHVT